MGKEIRKKIRGNWYYGWVKFIYLDYSGNSVETVRNTDWIFATKGQAYREAERLAGAFTSPNPVTKWERRYGRRPTPSRITISEIGVSKAPN